MEPCAISYYENCIIHHRMAKVQGLSEAMIRHIWKQHKLQPHLIKTFKVSITLIMVAMITKGNKQKGRADNTLSLHIKLPINLPTALESILLSSWKLTKPLFIVISTYSCFES